VRRIETTRRDFLRGAATGVGLLAAACGGARLDPFAPRYADPSPDPNGLFDLPAGFTYRVLSRTGDPMSDGLRVPGAPDGMGAFPGPDGRVIVIRNHELHSGTPELGPWPDGQSARRAGPWVYDPGHGRMPGLGGTTTFVYDPRTGQVEEQWLSLTGTYRNCAGGTTPWGTWISCEEATDLPGELAEREHGWCFEVGATRSRKLTAPQPLKALGRFNHEAVAVDPRSGALYLTEDRPDGLLYRFLPEQPRQLNGGGRLQALRFRDGRTDTRNWEETPDLPVGESTVVEWVDLDEVHAPADDLRVRGFEQHGAARFARGEGMWFSEEGIWFTCTIGGASKHGQIFRYLPSPSEGRPDEAKRAGRLEVFAEPNDASALESPDNLTVSLRGELFVAEDSRGDDRLVHVDSWGRVSAFGRNALNDSEITGPTFSPDGRTLFVNLQSPGITLAISGPF